MKIHAIYFSPTKGTKKCAEYFVKGTGCEYRETEITKPENRQTVCDIAKDEILLFACPVYGGHAAKPFTEYIKGIKGDNKCIIMTVYGNRHYDMANRDVFDIVTENGFSTVANVTGVGEHSFSEKLATDRPDEKDIEMLTEFGKQFAGRIAQNDVKYLGADDILQRAVDIATIGPHGASFRAMNPKTPIVSENCTRCGKCADICPMNAINPENPYEIKPVCIKCRACARVCPVKAIDFTQEEFGEVTALAYDQFGKERRIPEFVMK